ncbi:MAG: hypothetical protein FWE05_03020 [Defluviitaleaceae bacterium]|nr:hypothetical protein [Defluviitaleaceae bacterium]
MIEQQFYTRERRGLFRHSEGYDSIAKSEGLTDSFVKEKIHPYCTYTPPVSKSLTLVNYSCGRMLFGQSAYVPSDFTGQRSTFFSHNYVIPPESISALLGDIHCLLSTRFEVDYDIIQGKVLKNLDALPRGDSFMKLIVNESTMTKTIECICLSINRAKKTYVVVPVNTDKMHDYVCNFLVTLYQRLPEAIKHQLGFCTFARELDKRKGVHLVFLESKTARIGDLRFDGDFLVHINSDFENNNFEDTCHGDISAYLYQRILDTKIEQFFTEVGFWRVRLPFCCDIINTAAHDWLNKNLDKLTIAQIMAIPIQFIKHGLSGEIPSIYIILSILKYIVTAPSQHIDMKYLLGSYFLSSANYDRIVKNLYRLGIGSMKGID